MSEITIPKALQPSESTFVSQSARAVTQDLNFYRVPADLEDLLRILVKILEP